MDKIKASKMVKTNSKIKCTSTKGKLIINKTKTRFNKSSRISSRCSMQINMNSRTRACNFRENSHKYLIIMMTPRRKYKLNSI